MKNNKLLILLFSGLTFFSGCFAMPDGAIHPDYPIKPAYIVGRWTLPVDDSISPLYDTKIKKELSAIEMVLDFKENGTFTVETYNKGKKNLYAEKGMRWWLRTAENTNDTGPVVALKNLRYYPSAIVGRGQYYFPPNNPDELMLAVGMWFNRYPNDLYFCFETVDMPEVCFSRETPWKEKQK